MHLERLWLQDFRNYHEAELQFPNRGLTVINGSNGQGKTNLLEAIGFVASFGSFRGAPTEALVRNGADAAIVRGQGHRQHRELLIESELSLHGRSRTRVNKHPLQRRDREERLLATVFAPDDLELIKGGPALRRQYLDQILAASDLELDALVGDLDRILKQRNALLRSSSGRLDADAAITLDVWDERLAATGERLAAARVDLLVRLEPLVAKAYSALTSHSSTTHLIGLRMQSAWGSAGQLLDALKDARHRDVVRGVSTAGPHRDELDIVLNGLPARTQASQGEQRSLSLALRLASHASVEARTGASPILLLDDVFSELDEQRTASLLEQLPAAQTFLTTASPVPSATEPACVVWVDAGKVTLQ